MNEKAKAVSAASLAGLFALFALHGEAFFRGALGAWKFLLAIADNAPLGVGAFFWAIAMATLVQIALRRWIPEGRNRHTRTLIGDGLALAIALHIGWLQVPGRNGLMIGLLAGLSAPLLTRIILALSSWVGFNTLDRQAPTPPMAPPTPVPGLPGAVAGEIDPDADK